MANRHWFHHEFDMGRIGGATCNRGEGFPPVLGRIARLWPTGCATVGPIAVGWAGVGWATTGLRRVGATVG